MVDFGKGITLTCTFKDQNDVPVDPTSVSAFVAYPDGTKQSFTFGADDELTNPETGQYALYLVTNQPGIWSIAFQGAGAVVIGTETQFNVSASQFEVQRLAAIAAG